MLVLKLAKRWFKSACIQPNGSVRLALKTVFVATYTQAKTVI